MKDIRSQVYNALEKIMEQNGASLEEMESAIEWFEIHKRDQKKQKVYHMVIGREPAERFGDTSTRKEYLSTIQGYAPNGWVCVGVCGYHEK